jgi:hypothetical protein
MEERAERMVWATWLAGWMAGDSHCDWKVGFKSRYRGYEKVPGDFNLDRWTVEHTVQVREAVRSLAVREDWTIGVEDQNSLSVPVLGLGYQGVVKVAGKPDILAVSQDEVRVVDVKTGNPRVSDSVQVMIYLWMIDKSPKFSGKKLSGSVYYSQTRTWKEIKLPKEFEDQLLGFVRTLGTGEELRKSPSLRECEHCDISKVHCPERIEQGASPA